MKDCIFCKIAKEEIPSSKFWENDKYIAILDLNPNVKGMSLVIPKEHHDSHVFKMNDEDYSGIMLAAKQVTFILEKGLNVKRVALVMEGLGVNHAHIKLYPIYGLEKEFEETWSKDRVYFNQYPGYISTQLGPEAKKEELEKIAKMLREFSS